MVTSRQTPSPGVRRSEWWEWPTTESDRLRLSGRGSSMPTYERSYEAIKPHHCGTAIESASSLLLAPHWAARASYKKTGLGGRSRPSVKAQSPSHIPTSSYSSLDPGRSTLSPQCLTQSLSRYNLRDNCPQSACAPLTVSTRAGWPGSLAHWRIS